jgi:hypothetical protein
MAKENTSGDIILSGNDLEYLRKGQAVSISGPGQPSMVLPPCSLSGHEWRYSAPDGNKEVYLERNCSNCSTVECAEIDFEGLQWE